MRLVVMLLSAWSVASCQESKRQREDAFSPITTRVQMPSESTKLATVTRGLPPESTIVVRTTTSSVTATTQGSTSTRMLEPATTLQVQKKLVQLKVEYFLGGASYTKVRGGSGRYNPSSVGLPKGASRKIDTLNAVEDSNIRDVEKWGCLVTTSSGIVHCDFTKTMKNCGSKSSDFLSVGGDTHLVEEDWAQVAISTAGEVIAITTATPKYSDPCKAEY